MHINNPHIHINSPVGPGAHHWEAQHTHPVTAHIDFMTRFDYAAQDQAVGKRWVLRDARSLLSTVEYTGHLGALGIATDTMGSMIDVLMVAEAPPTQTTEEVVESVFRDIVAPIFQANAMQAHNVVPGGEGTCPNTTQCDLNRGQCPDGRWPLTGNRMDDCMCSCHYTPEDGLDADERDPDFGGPEWYIGATVQVLNCSLDQAAGIHGPRDSGCHYISGGIIELLGESKAQVLVMDGDQRGELHTLHFDMMIEHEVFDTRLMEG